ncbi:MAG: DUF2007 domain-containing protein [Acidobacteria bacterium]|nr:DUF2007 domain-containing protein [Acidobacteriota bacterium]MBU1338232.1 DUF2007 domain-containing protein [Acidobacteriota bacterium]MBU1474331.1 DUF2007 domain-containing protein [Acidobacteriota bacterium]
MTVTKDDKTIRKRDLEFKEIAKVQGSIEAEVIRSFLESNGISVLFRGLVVQSVHAFTADGLGQIRILVPAGDFETARKLMEVQNGESGS